MEPMRDKQLSELIGMPGVGDFLNEVNGILTQLGSDQKQREATTLAAAFLPIIKVWGMTHLSIGNEPPQDVLRAAMALLVMSFGNDKNLELFKKIGQKNG